MQDLRWFTDITVDILREDGIEAFLPTFMAVSREDGLRVVEGIPDHVDHRAAI